MFSQKTLSILLVSATIALSVQTVALAQMSSALSEANIGVATPTSINFSSDGSAPQMVGGC